MPDRVPRIARLMALAIRFESLIQSRTINNYADLARLAHVSRARITQIMNLLLLAPEIQEAILFLRPVAGTRPNSYPRNPADRSRLRLAKAARALEAVT